MQIKIPLINFPVLYKLFCCNCFRRKHSIILSLSHPLCSEDEKDAFEFKKGKRELRYPYLSFLAF